MPNVPETHYARSGGIDLAYQVIGDGPLDLVFVPALGSLLEDAGEHELKGVPEPWQLFRVDSRASS